MSMPDNEIIKIVSRHIRTELARYGAVSEKIMLFGSRARHDAVEDSDWDFLVITDRALSVDAKTGIKMAVRKVMAATLVPVDIIIKDSATYRRQASNVGYITYYAARDGVPV